MHAPGSPVGGKICRRGHQLPGLPAASNAGKPGFAGFSPWHGACCVIGASCRPLSVRRCWSFAMFLAAGAASSAIDALKALTSSKSSAQSTGVGQNARSPFDLLSQGSTASAGSSAGFGSGGGSQISPETMSALLDAQSQSSAGSANSASREPLQRAEGSVRADRRRRRRQDHQIGIRRGARRRRHQSGAGRQRVRQARQGRRRRGESR